MFMFMANSTEYYNWQETLELHRDMVHCVNSGDQEAATESIRRHLSKLKRTSTGYLERQGHNS